MKPQAITITKYGAATGHTTGVLDEFYGNIEEECNLPLIPDHLNSAEENKFRNAVDKVGQDGPAERVNATITTTRIVWIQPGEPFAKGRDSGACMTKSGRI